MTYSPRSFALLEALEADNSKAWYDAHRAEFAVHLLDPFAATLEAASAPAERFFTAAAPSYRRNVLRWMARAKRPETREKRIAETVARSAAAEKVPQM
ncbi:MAG: DUF2461 family protein [Paracoccaceae bacterium]